MLGVLGPGYFDNGEKMETLSIIKFSFLLTPRGEMVTCKISMEKCWISPSCWFQLSLNEICKFWTGYSFSL